MKKIIRELLCATLVFGSVFTSGVSKIYAADNKIEVKTSPIEVLIGYTGQSTSDIVITETTSNTFQDGEKFTLKLEDNLNSDFSTYYGITSAVGRVVSGDAEIDDFKVKDNTITFTLDKGDIVNQDNNALLPMISIIITEVSVYSEVDVPSYNSTRDAISLKVSSTKNFESAKYYDYIKFVNEYASVDRVLNKDVVIQLGSSSAILNDGTKVDLSGASYIATNGNTMLPVKGTALALGLAPENIIYTSENKTATFFLPQDMVAQVQAGNSYATVNGKRIALTDANGNLVTPVVKEGRFYLPLRAVAMSVFGIEVEYDVTDKSVTLNPSN